MCPLRNEDHVPSRQGRIAVYVRVAASQNYLTEPAHFIMADGGTREPQCVSSPRFLRRCKSLFSRLEAFMKATIDELNCEGTILIDRIERGLVTCWLTKEQTGIEGTIVGEEATMIEIQAAGKACLRLHDGSILPIRSCGGSNGIRWVKVLSAS
jgi:hypothetical protein